MKYRIRLWDFDGTLADTGRDVWNSIQYAAKKCGGEIDRDYMKKDSNLGKPLAEIFEKVMPYPGKQKFGQFEQLVRIHYREISMYESTYLYHGIAEILESAEVEDAADYVITMKPKSALERILETKGWSNLFTDCLSPDSFDGKEKKKSELISYILEKTGCKPEETVYIGDTWSDVIAARENNIDCIGVTYGDGDTGELLAENPRFCVDSVCELKKILEEGA